MYAGEESELEEMLIFSTCRVRVCVLIQLVTTDMALCVQ